MKYLGHDHFELSTGRQFYANCGIIGLGADAKPQHTDLCYGYDGAEDIHDWTPQERQEVGDYMVALWMKWRDWQ